MRERVTALVNSEYLETMQLVKLELKLSVGL